MSDIKIIAEIGVNHNGSYDQAIRLVDEAKSAGASTVKFQTFITEKCMSKSVGKVAYQIQETGQGSQFDMVKSLELSFDEHQRIKQYCDSINIEYLSTAFDFESLDFIVNDLNLDTLKVASGEITNAPLLLAHGRTTANVYLSTGMSTLGDVERALSVLAFGAMNKEKKCPDNDDFIAAYTSNEGQSYLQRNVTLLHCTTEYPAPPDEVNMLAMQTMRSAFNLPVGYSDHTVGYEASIAAVAVGAVVIERHFTLDKTLVGPDHKASLEPHEFKQFVMALNKTQSLMGSARKQPSPSELAHINRIRKVIIAEQNILKGQPFTEHNVSIKRGEGNMSPFEYWALLGKNAERNYIKDEPIHA